MSKKSGAPKGNKNAVKSTTKTDRLVVRLSKEDKMKINNRSDGNLSRKLLESFVRCEELDGNPPLILDALS